MRQLNEFIGTGWNEFWFTPRVGLQLVWIRHLAAVTVLTWLGCLSPALVDLFGETGWVTPSLVHQLTTEGDPGRSSPGFSFLFLLRSASGLWAAHLISMAAILLVALGISPRWSTPAAWFVVLSYVHRAPMMVTSFESVLCWLFLYLCLAPGRSGIGRTQPLVSTWTANLSLRLIQVHVCALYVLMSTFKLGSIAWTRGEAAWYLFTDTRHALVDLSALAASSYLVNAVTHVWLWTEMLFPILIWVRPFRPLVLTIAALIWLVRGLVTGQAAFSLIMMIACMAFLTPKEDD